MVLCVILYPTLPNYSIFQSIWKKINLERPQIEKSSYLHTFCLDSWSLSTPIATRINNAMAHRNAMREKIP